jgi:hypothetical protein
MDNLAQNYIADSRKSVTRSRSTLGNEKPILNLDKNHLLAILKRSMDILEETF